MFYRCLSFIAIALLFPLWTSAQSHIEGQVLDAQTREPLPFVNVTYNGMKGGTTGDIDGYFILDVEANIQSLQFSYVGYQKKSIQVTGNLKKPLVILLEEDRITLLEATVLPGENPAHRIIRKASEARKKNDPLALNSFQYKSYNKLIFTINADSLNVLDSIGGIDSSNYEMKKFFDRNHLFMMESATERKYIKGSRDHEEVLASRISGFQNPTFTLVGTQLQSFSFYNDELEVLFIRFINPLRNNSMREYFFLLQDTLFSEVDQDTVYVVGFRPKKPERKDLLKGALYIGTRDYALRNVMAEFVDSSAEGNSLSVQIQQKYAQYGAHWFPVQLLTDLLFSGIRVNDAVPHGFGRTYIQDIQVDAPLQKKDIPRLELSLSPDANQKDESFWAPLRPMPLDSKEEQTFVVIDSIGEEVGLEKRVGFFTQLAQGKLRFGWVDFDLDRLFRYNLPYEGLRLGLGAHTNERLSQHVQFGGYFGYGLQDFGWKYGADFKYQPVFAGPWTLVLDYHRDIEETGGAAFMLDRKPGFLSGGNIRWFNIERFDWVERAAAQVHIDLRPNLTLGLSATKESRTLSWPKYQNELALGALSWEGMLYGAALSWAPNDRYMAGPNGRRRLATTYPIVQVDYRLGQTQNQSEAVADEIFHRLSLRAVQLWKNLRYGDLRLEGEMGTTLGSATAAGYLFAPRSNLRTRQVTEEPSSGLGAPHSFEALFNNEFTADLQVQMLVDYYFPDRVLKIGTWSPRMVLQQRILWGQMTQADLYRPYFSSVQAPDEVYWESGIEFQKLYNTIGLGFYYRYGAYARPEFVQNFSIKLTTTGLF